MDPVTVTVGAATAALVVKAMEKAGEKSVDAGVAALNRLVEWLRVRFSQRNEPVAEEALTNVENVPDSPSREQALAAVINRYVDEDPSFKNELEDMLEQVRDSGVPVAPISQIAVGDQNVQAAQITGSSIIINYHSPKTRRA